MTAVNASPAAFATRSPDASLRELWQPAVQRTAGLPFVAREATAAASDLVAAASRAGRLVGEHVHLANAYSVAVADEHRVIADVFTEENAWLLPDGRPLVWLSAMRRDDPRLHQVRGPQFMLDVADLGRSAGLRHYLLGGSSAVLQELQKNLTERFPGISIVGASSPPFRPSTDAELEHRDDAIRASGAQVVWVGLGTPKQDVEAARLAAALPVVAVAVGAAFDYAAGAMRPAPRWISLVGFEWLWRLVAEPRRLWKRYTFGNLRFLGAALRSGLRSDRKRGVTNAPRTTVVGQLPPPLHGSAVMTQRLVETLRADGEDVEVVDRRFSRSADEVGRPAMRKVFAIPSLLVRFTLAVRRSERLVLLITTSPASFLIDLLLLSMYRRPVVLYVHTVGFRALAGRGRLWRAMVRRALRCADEVVVLGRSLIEDVEPFVPRDRIVVIPNTTPPAEVRRREPGHRLLFLSNLLPGKGADTFVRLARRLLDRYPAVPWQFDLAGAGDPSALGALPVELTVHGRVTGDAKRDLLDEADVLVFPSTYAMEAQPLVIVEALSCGLPVVAYDTGGVRDLVDDTVGKLVPAGDEHALAAALAELLESTDRVGAAGEAARARYDRQHSGRAYAEAWREVLRGGTKPAGGCRRSR